MLLALAFALALGALAVSPFRHAAEVTLAKRTLLQLAAAGALLWIALDAPLRARCLAGFSRAPLRTLGLAGLALLAWTGASLAWAPTAVFGLPLWSDAAAAAAMLVAVSTLCTTPAARAGIAAALVVGASATALLGIAQFLFGFDAIPQSGPPAATFGNRNFAAQVVVLALPLSLVGVRVARTPAVWLGSLGALSAMVVFLVYARSSAGWICGALALAIVAAPLLRANAGAMRVPAGRGRIAAAVVALVAVAGLGRLDPDDPALATQSVSGEIATLGRDARAYSGEGFAGVRGSARGRVAMLYNTGPMIADHPVAGVGLGAWRIYYPRYANAVVETGIGLRSLPFETHNDYAQIVAETGLVGGALAAWLAVAVAIALRRAIAAAPEGPERLMAWGAAASLAALAVNAAVSFPLQKTVPVIWGAAILGLLLGPLLPDPRAADPAEPRWWRAAFAGGAAALLTAASVHAVDAWRYDLALSRVLTTAASGADGQALRLGAALRERDRDDRVLLSRLGDIHLRRKSAAGLPYFERIEAFDPWNPANLMGLAWSHDYAGHDAEAIAYAERALEIVPGCGPCARFLAARR